MLMIYSVQHWKIVRVDTLACNSMLRVHAVTAECVHLIMRSNKSAAPPRPSSDKGKHDCTNEVGSGATVSFSPQQGFDGRVQASMT